MYWGRSMKPKNRRVYLSRRRLTRRSNHQITILVNCAERKWWGMRPSLLTRENISQTPLAGDGCDRRMCITYNTPA